MADEVRLIDAELLTTNIAQIAKACAKSDKQKALIGRILFMIENMPAIEAELVKHGRWEHGECSVCGASPLDHVSGDMYVEVDYYPNYCPNCGVRMIGGDNNG